MKLDLDKYTIYRLYDSYDMELIGLVALNNKHSIEDFQNAINKAKQKYIDEIIEFGDDWSYIEKELDNFDYYTIDYGCDFIEY